jgi:hypothetical protein
MEINKKDFQQTVRCAKKVVDHIRRKREECYPKLTNIEKSSDYEKCVRSTLVKMGLFALCSLGLGKAICETYDLIMEEEKNIGRKVTDQEFYDFVLKAAKKYRVIDEEVI